MGFVKNFSGHTLASWRRYGPVKYIVNVFFFIELWDRYDNDKFVVVIMFYNVLSSVY